MCWAEKVTLALFALVALVLLLIGSTAGASDIHPGALLWLASYGVILGTLLMKVFVPLWIALRVLDLIARGPARRALRRIARR